MTQAMQFSAFKGPFAERIDVWNGKLYMVSDGNSTCPRFALHAFNKLGGFSSISIVKSNHFRSRLPFGKRARPRKMSFEKARSKVSDAPPNLRPFRETEC